ncbi:2OG-Fe(II) oxygenase family protein [Sphingomonas naphthae]|uniref:2OG-Fe(II) oxygenase family protein n=1 Tax=Sphingomonas naphthae TaxID=1813468 RepID=A0ABY7TGS9_9SPHN|nr:2OG-Fe(II) oxygenase family protein [Sphingomonas naphthae]WCT72437.1 2OG-Fe(II) oxygenase family protein [Sphingomonas naphthae]
MAAEPGFALDPSLDGDRLAARYAAEGVVVIDGWLAGDGAARLHADLRGRGDWRQIVSSGDTGGYELDRATRAGMSEAQRAQLDTAIYAAARYGFQYRFETIRVPDDEAARAAEGGLLADLARFLSGGAVRDLLRRITGAEDIAFADAQATAYSPGDFLTGHDDAVAGKNRRAAYVLGLTPQWRTEWGGLLLFHGQDGRVRGIEPGFNRLSLFRVPQMHSVSEVTRAAAYRRYSITGWLRAAG